MAKKTVSQLPAAESMGENDVLLMETPLATKCITKNALLQDVNTTLASKADAEHTHAIADVTGLQKILDGKANTADLKTVATTGSYNDLTDKPSISGAYELPQATDSTLGGIKVGEGLAINSESGVLSLNSHTHAIADVTDLQDTLTGKADAKHTHAIADVTGLQTALDGKADAKHTHEGYATETFVTTKIAEASLSGKEVDLSGYATKEELKSKADTSSIPTKTSELTNDSGFLTSHQDVGGKADKTYVDAELAKKANKSHTHSYNDLTDTPSIPSTDELATKKELTDGLATKSDATHNHDKTYSKLNHVHDQYLTEHQNISHLALKSELHSHSNKTVLDGITSAKVNEWNNKSTFDGNYNSLTNKPTIPTVPTKTSELTNDSGFIKSIPSEYVTETELNAKKYLTAHQDISGKVDKVEGKGLSTNDLTNELKSKYDTAYTHSQSAHFSGSYNDLTGIPTIPTSLPANGGNAATVSGISLAIKTSEEYTALEAKSDKTLYIISDGGKIYLGSTLIAEVNSAQTE